MLHLGLNILQYVVKFDSSCYYPYTLDKERRNTKVLFGASFGFFRYNSISIARRPSEDRIDKMDLFAYTYSNGFKAEEYVGSVDIEKRHLLKLAFEKNNKIFRLQAFEYDQAIRIVNFSTHYAYPLCRIGYTIAKTYGDKILMQKI